MTLLPLRGMVERRLSALTGAQVTLGRLGASVKRGAVEASEVEVKFDHVATLRIPRVVAEVSLAGALRKNLTIQSVVLERPVFSIVQQEDGTLAIPIRRSENSRHSNSPPPEKAPADEREWKLDVSRVLLVDGEVRFLGTSGHWAGYEFVAGGVLGELLRTPRGFKFTLIVQSPARVDCPATFGEIKAVGEIVNGPVGAANLADESVFANVDLAPSLQAKLECASLSTAEARLNLRGRLDIPILLQLLPASLAAFGGVNGGTGSLKIRATMTRAPGGTIRIPTLDLRVRDVTMALPSRRNSTHSASPSAEAGRTRT